MISAGSVQINLNFQLIQHFFSLGEFDATVTTYQHLMLHSRATSKHPVMIDPIFFPCKEGFYSLPFLYFMSSWTEAHFKKHQSIWH